MNTLQELEAKYQAKKAQQDKEEARRETEKKLAQQQQLNQLFPQILDLIAKTEDVTSEELREYGELSGNWNWHSGKLESLTFVLTLAGHQAISLDLYLQEMIYHNQGWQVDQNNRRAASLAESLAMAAYIWQQNQEYLQAREEQEKAYQVDREKQAQVKQEKQANLNHLFKQIGQDPVALALVRVFLEIRQERGQAEDVLAQMQESLNTAYHDGDEGISQANQQAKEAQQEAGIAQEQARSLEYRVDDLEKDLKKQKRKY